MWKLLSDALGEKITKVNSRSALERQFLHPAIISEILPTQIASRPIASGHFASQPIASPKGQESLQQAESLSPVKIESYPVHLISPEISVALGSKSCLPATAPMIDWEDATAVEVLYGRQAELSALGTWVVRDRCRLIGIFGVGGIGKTSFSIQLTQQLVNADLISDQSPAFEFLIWRSLRSAPPIADLLSDLIQVLSRHQEVIRPATVSEQISRLLH